MQGKSLNLGACCICETATNVQNMIMLDSKSPTPGKGWGCTLCKLSADGAMVVLCDGCLDQFRAGKTKLKYACRGFPEEDGRILIENLQGIHEHDLELHELDLLNRFGRSRN